MIRDSGASLKIENGLTDSPPDMVTERRVTIFGPLEAHWKAQCLIFQKLTEDGRLPDDLKLTLEMAVPTDFVGRLIGRGGARIKEIQAESGANVKFLTEEVVGDVTFAQMYGTFNTLYSAQVKLRRALSIIRKQREHGIQHRMDEPIGARHEVRIAEPDRDRDREQPVKEESKADIPFQQEENNQSPPKTVS